MENSDLVKYFIKHTDERFNKIEKKIDSITSFKWKAVGAAGVMGFIMSFSFEILMMKFR